MSSDTSMYRSTIGLTILVAGRSRPWRLANGIDSRAMVDTTLRLIGAATSPLSTLMQLHSRDTLATDKDS